MPQHTVASIGFAKIAVYALIGWCELTFEYNPDHLAREVAAKLELSMWREKLSNDALTAKWAHLFDHIEPPEDVINVTRSLLMATQGSISPAYLYSISLAAWTYGVAWAFNQINDEKLRLWEGTVLDFPWMDAKDYPAREGFDDEGG